jgi:hypothetical protein
MEPIKLGNRLRKVLVAYNEVSDKDFPAHETLEETKQGLRVTCSTEQAMTWAHYIMEARTWSEKGFAYTDNSQRNNVLRVLHKRARLFAEIAGQELDTPIRRNAKTKGADVDTSGLPTEPVEDLVKGDEIMVVRHITRYGLNTIERWPARVEGRAENGDYWVTSLEDSTSRACRPTEVVLVRRAEQKA